MVSWWRPSPTVEQRFRDLWDRHRWQDLCYLTDRAREEGWSWKLEYAVFVPHARECCLPHAAACLGLPARIVFCAQRPRAITRRAFEHRGSHVACRSRSDTTLSSARFTEGRTATVVVTAGAIVYAAAARRFGAICASRRRAVGARVGIRWHTTNVKHMSRELSGVRLYV